LPFVNRLSKRIFISKDSIEKVKKQYLENNIPGHLTDKIEYIPNQVMIHAEYSEKKKKQNINIIYVGRGSKEKRVNIIGSIAKKSFELGLPVDFLMIGNNKYSVEDEYHQYLKFIGEITDPSIMEKIYLESDLILITSSREGFPMVVMEAMSFGSLPISTDVGDISLHINNGFNGFIIPNYPDEELIIKAFVSYIEKICSNEFGLKDLSKNAYEYAKNNFSSDAFHEKYRSLLLKGSE